MRTHLNTCANYAERANVKHHFRFHLTAYLLGAISLCGCTEMEEVDRGLYSANEAVTQQNRMTGKRELNFYDRQKQIAVGNGQVELLKDEAAQGRKLNE